MKNDVYEGETYLIFFSFYLIVHKNGVNDNILLLYCGNHNNNKCLERCFSGGLNHHRFNTKLKIVPQKSKPSTD